jgi:predicted RNase H-like HicB family nuclease
MCSFCGEVIEPAEVDPVELVITARADRRRDDRIGTQMSWCHAACLNASGLRDLHVTRSEFGRMLRPIGEPGVRGSLSTNPANVPPATGSGTPLDAYTVDVRLTAAITHEGPWYVARCLEVEVASQGETVEQALANLREALELYFEGDPVPEVGEQPIIVSVEIAA